MLKEKMSGKISKVKGCQLWHLKGTEVVSSNTRARFLILKMYKFNIMNIEYFCPFAYTRNGWLVPDIHTSTHLMVKVFEFFVYEVQLFQIMFVIFMEDECIASTSWALFIEKILIKIYLFLISDWERSYEEWCKDSGLFISDDTRYCYRLKLR